jgi:hypothetical protein
LVGAKQSLMLLHLTLSFYLIQQVLHPKQHQVSECASQS